MAGLDSVEPRRPNKDSRTLARLLKLAPLLLVVLMAPPAGAAGQPNAPARFDDEAALDVSQAAIGGVIPDYELRDRQGDPVALAGFRGKPLVLSFIYTSCSHTCPLMTKQLARVVEIARDALGERSFNVVTIGFDAANDTPDRMRIFAAERRVDDPRWWFLSGEAATVEALARTAGFVYFSSAKGFEHLAQTTVIDGEGRIYRQVYGELLTPTHLVEPLKQLVFGRPASASTLDGWVNGVRLFCTVFDPASGRYMFDYSLFVGILAGLVALGSIAVFVVRTWRQSHPV